MQKIIIFVLTSLILITQPVNAKDEFFLMLKNKKVNVRYGPGFDYQVKYIYKKIQLPLKVIDIESPVPMSKVPVLLFAK